MTLTLGGVDLESRVNNLERIRIKHVTPFETAKRVYYARRANLENILLRGILHRVDDESTIESLEQMGHRIRPVWLDLGDEQTMVLANPPTLKTLAKDVSRYEMLLQECDWVFEGSEVFNDDFNGGKQETWTEESGTWAVEGDEYSGGYTGTGEAKSSGGSESWTDYYVEADVKLIAGTYVGICVRYVTSPSWHYYKFIITPGSSKVQLKKVASGIDDELAYAEKVSLNTNTWYNLQLECYKNTVKGFVDDREMVKIPRRDYTAGKIMLIAYGFNPHAHFDNVLVVED